MKTKRWKLFIDYEKEEKWLNKKMAEGLAMTNYSPCRYTFEECPPGEYIYRIELLKNRVNHPDSIKYIQFMEDNGAEHIASYLNWVYFRKKAAEEPFEIYSDLESRVIHYQRIVRLWIFIGIVSLAVFLIQVGNFISFIIDDYTNVPFYVVVFTWSGVFFLLIAVLFFRFLPRYMKKVKMLKRERDVRE